MRNCYGKLEAGWIPGHPLAFKKNAVGKIQHYDAVVNIVSSVGSAVVSVVDWAINEVIEPVVNTVGQVIEGMLDNPVKTIAQVVAIVTQNYWALPLIEGADVAAKGGDIEDVAKAVAISYVTQKIGAPVAREVSSAAVAAGASETTAAILGQASASSAVAVVRGQDPVEAFIRGGVTAAVPVALGKVEAFSELPAPAQNVLAASVTAALTGQDVGIAAINSAVASINVGSKVLKELDPDKKMTPQQSAIAAQMINRITSSALTGTNPSAAVQSALINVGVKELGNKIDDQVQEWVDSLKLGVDGLEIKSKEVSELQTQYETAHGEWVSLANEFNGRLANVQTKEAEVERLRTVYNGNKTEANANALNAAIQDYNAATNSFNADYASKYKDQLAYYEQYVPSLENRINIAVGEYDDMSNIVEDSSNSIGEWMDKNYYATAQAFVGVMDPNFNPEEYRQINNIAEDEDVYEHWLTTGQFEGLRTNAAAAEGEILLERSRLLQDIAKETGVALSQITEEDIQRLSKLMMDTYGLDLTRLKAATAGTFSEDTQIPFDDLLQEIKTDKEVLQTKPYGDWNKPPDYTPPTGYNLATADDVANNRSIQVMAPNGIPVWLTPGRIEGWDPVVGDTNTPIRIDINGVGDADAYGPDADSSINITPSSPPPTLENLYEIDPLSWMTITQELPAESQKRLDQTLLDIAKGGVTLIEKAGASEGTLTLVGNILKGTGQVFQSFGGLVAAIGQNPNDSRLYSLGKGLVDIGTATTSAEYQAAIKNISKMVGDAKGVKETFFAILKAAGDYPVEFASEYLGVEAVSEIVPLLIGGGAAKVTEGALIAQGMAKQLAERAAAKVGVSTAIASDVLESAGGSAANAFEETYRVAIQKGLSEENATKAALDVAARTATIAAITTLGANKLGGAALEKFMLGDKALGTADALKPYEKIQDFITTGGAITIKEGVSGAGQQGIIQAYLEGQLYQLDPTRDIAGNITSAATFGGIAGGGISGGIFAGSQGASLVGNAMKANAEVQDILSQEWSSQGELAKALTEFTGVANVGLPNAFGTSSVSSGGTSTTYRSNPQHLGLLSTAGFRNINTSSFQTDAVKASNEAIKQSNINIALSNLQNYLFNPTGTKIPSTVSTQHLPSYEAALRNNAGYAPTYSLSPVDTFNNTGYLPAGESSQVNSNVILNMGMGYADVLKSYFGDQVLNTQDLVDYTNKNNLNVSDKYIDNLINSMYTPITFDKAQIQNIIDTAQNAGVGINNTNEAYFVEAATRFMNGDRSIIIKSRNEDGKYINETLNFKSPYQWQKTVKSVYDPVIGRNVNVAEYSLAPVTIPPEQSALNEQNAQKYLTYVSNNRGLSVDQAMAKLKEYQDNFTNSTKYFINTDNLSDQQKLDFTKRLNAVLDSQPLNIGVEDVTAKLIAQKSSTNAANQWGLTPEYAQNSLTYLSSMGEINPLTGFGEGNSSFANSSLLGNLQTYVSNVAITTPWKLYYDITQQLGAVQVLDPISRKYVPVSEKKDYLTNIFTALTPDASQASFTSNTLPLGSDPILAKLSTLSWDETYAFLDQAFPGFSAKFPKDTITRAAFEDVKGKSPNSGAIVTLDTSPFGKFIDSRIVTASEVNAFTRDNSDKFLGNFDLYRSLFAPTTLNVGKSDEYYDPLVSAYINLFKDIEVPPDHPDYENEVLKKLPEFYNKAFIADQELDAIFKDLNYREVLDPETRAKLAGSLKYSSEGSPGEILASTEFGSFVDLLMGVYGQLLPSNAPPADVAAYDPEKARESILQLIDSRVNTLRDEVTSYYDPLALDRSEIIDVFKQEGITNPTDEQIQQFLDAGYDEAAGITALRAYADPISVTPDEVREQLLAAGYTNIDDSEIEQFAKFLPESEVFPTIAAYARDKTFSREEAIEFYNQLGFTPTEEQIQQFVKQGKDVNKDAIRYEMSEYVDPLYVTPDEVREQYEILGFSKPTDADITKFIGQRLESEIPDVLKDYLPTAQYNSISQEFQEYKTQAEQAAATQQSLIGAQGRDVTQEDLLAIRDIIAQQQANPDIQLTPEQLAYDANRDGKIDTDDQLFLTTYLQQTTQGGAPEFKPPPGSIWAPTGLYGQIANLQNQVATGGIGSAAQQEALRQTQAALRTSQQRQNVSQLYNFLQMEPGFGPTGGTGAGQVKAPDPAKIGYIYDWSSIFANPQQERMFISPYAEGGAVEYEVTDELLKILRG
jgi:hypothetical protein